MNKKRKKGFTLIELLAVIVILAIIALIATPIIVGVFNKSKKNAFMDTAYGVVEAGKLYYAKNFNNDDFTGKTFTFPAASDDLKLSGEKIGGGSLEVNGKGGQTLAIYDKGKNWCASKKETDSKISIDKYEEGKCGSTSGDNGTEYTDPVLKGSSPVLENGLIPVTIENNGTVKKADTNKKWYNYENKEWANAVLVSSDVRSTYKNGDVIPEEKILAYFVWIPRYRYTLFNVEGAQVSPQEINIVFENKTSTKIKGTTNGSDLTHPAFTYDAKEVNGFWVGKFETTTKASAPTIKPNIAFLSNQNVSTQFITALKFGNRTFNQDGTITDNEDKNQYGLIEESRMMKNIEWGAVAYLSHSKYGINNEIRVNNNKKGLTGCGAATEILAADTDVCEIEYGKAAAYPQSTTGNITGVFDMSGGAIEYVMGVTADNTNTAAFYSGFDSSNNSGFNGRNGKDNSYTSGKNIPNIKYYDLYKYSTLATPAEWAKRFVLGDATMETRGWYGDIDGFSYSTLPWFERGGGHGGSFTTQPGIFGVNGQRGGAGTSHGFRTVIF